MIRLANINDYNKVSKVHYEVHKIHADNRPDIFNDIDNTLDKEYYNSLIKSDAENIFVYEKDAEIIAFAIIKESKSKDLGLMKSRNFLYINDFVVSSVYRGKGVSKELYNYIKEYAKNKKMDAIELGVWSFNERAIKFYENMGMQEKMKRMEDIL
ncbi:MAG: GNAT family N-acetyltransferase [Clostridia bacterium]|jgi:ribosomal protein S18 acetylase RimI-like enzyme|nr:GNAT family N-acetyltransferase [Clostridia bacterium]